MYSQHSPPRPHATPPPPPYTPRRTASIVFLYFRDEDNDIAPAITHAAPPP